jgi:hypothetical protein
MTKKFLLTTLGAGMALNAFAQLPVSTSPQNRKVVIEEFTGIKCQHCPDGHKRVNALKAARPSGSIIAVNIHTGGYAAPSSGQPDYRTSEGNAIAAISTMGITGYPTGCVSRHMFAGKTALAMSRGDWARYSDSLLARSAYVNVALEGDINTATRVLTVKVQAYFTASSTAASNNLTVMLLEDKVNGPQIDNNGSGVAYYPEMRNTDGTYTHNHMLRKTLTSSATLGDVITPTTSGTTINKTYTYTIPAQFSNTTPTLKNLRLVAFIAEGNSEIITASEVGVKIDGVSVAELNNNFSQIAVYPNPAQDNATISFSLQHQAEVNISVVDAMGRIVSVAANRKFDQGINKVEINTSALSSGIYNVMIQSEGGRKTERLAVVK